MTLDETTVPVRAEEDVATADFDDEAVLWHLPSNRVHLLNGTAALVWRLCDGTGTVAELVDDLASVFDASRDEIAAGVTGVLEELVADGLVTTG